MKDAPTSPKDRYEPTTGTGSDANNESSKTLPTRMKRTTSIYRQPVSEKCVDLDKEHNSDPSNINPFQKLPNDMVRLILGMSGNPMRTASVCKQFNTSLNRPVYKEKHILISAKNKPEEYLLKAAKQKNSEDLAKVLIKHMPNIFSRLELFSVACCHESVAFLILDDKELTAKLNGADLAQMGWYHLEIAHRILDAKELTAKLDSADLAEMGRRLLEIAHRILDAKELTAKFSGPNLSQMGVEHLEIAHRILDDSELATKLNGALLASMVEIYVFKAHKYFERAHRSLVPSILPAKLNHVELATMAQHRFEIALRILDDSELAEKFHNYKSSIMPWPSSRSTAKQNILNAFEDHHNKVMGCTVKPVMGMKDKCCTKHSWDKLLQLAVGCAGVIELGYAMFGDETGILKHAIGLSGVLHLGKAMFGDEASFLKLGITLTRNHVEKTLSFVSFVGSKIYGGSNRRQVNQSDFISPDHFVEQREANPLLPQFVQHAAIPKVHTYSPRSGKGANNSRKMKFL